ncbi:hypothetical protein B5F96_06250 [Parabacteroides johnsonii]|uniref:DNA methylase N-4/N-6 domain-containing protein n=1 Tax=Parabacteroides johnsonii TaxID=387661 RepID=A0A9Q5ST33_9BACT|nr:DNA methyltransferase [Parabacteroides johnsonii]OUO06092.1 hypothetical protein B5F96_06250 [Parabacteroides johnsonii]
MSKKTYNSGEPSLGLELEEETATEQKDPVTVLGLTFANDDERREYFRAELRRKLPELRNIEGFPIGEDDDIIALSDPPYYTACPNPWLNDFIAEWEAEKKDLEAKGLRKTDFEVTEPYSADVSEGKSNSIYMAHSYHTKVPHPAIMRYLLHYTQPGDIVLDGFCGTGMTGVAANLCGSKSEVDGLKLSQAVAGCRHSICSDLSPIASFITYNFNTYFDAEKFNQQALHLISKVEKELSWLYETETESGGKAKVIYTVWSESFVCPNCGQTIAFAKVSDSNELQLRENFICENCSAIFSKRQAEKKFETVMVSDDIVNQNSLTPVLIRYELGQKQTFKKPTNFDDELCSRINSLPYSSALDSFILPDGVKTKELIQNGRIKASCIYTKRNLIAFEALWNAAKDLPLFRFVLTSVLVKTGSLLHNIGLKNGKINLAGALPNALFIPSMLAERNVFDLVRGKLKDILKIKLYPNRSGVNQIESATSLENLKDNSIDYIFIDPPFGANLMYSELNFIHESWLHLLTDNRSEAIENSIQHKNLFDYTSLMNKSLSEFYRVLKPGKWITIEFSNTSASVWNSIQTSIINSGFVVANVSALDKQQGSFNSQTTTTAVKQDLIISCFKPSEKLLEHFENMRQSDDNQNIFVSTQSFIEELLTRLPVIIVNEKKTTAVVERSPKILYDRLIAFFVQNGRQIPMDASEFQRFLRDTFVERDGMFFTAEQAIKYDDLRRQNPEMVSLALFVGSEADGVQWLKRELADKPQTYQDLQPKWMQDLVAPKKGDAIPELMQILEENFLKNEDSQWYIPDAENEADLEKVRTRRLLREFKTYVEAAEKPKGRIKEARLEALRTGFKNCYQEKDFATIVRVGDRIPQSLLTEDDVLLQYYDIATNRI